MEEDVRDDEAEDGVAEEFEGFVVVRVVVFRFMRMRLVGERAHEELAPGEGVIEPFFEGWQIQRRKYYIDCGRACRG